MSTAHLPPPGPHLRTATPADRDAVCALLAEASSGPGSPTDEATPALVSPAAHDWLYWDNPWGAPHNVVWEDGGRIVGHAGMYPGEGRVEGRLVRFGRISHVATARAYRGRGLYGALVRRVVEESARDIDLVVALPTPAAVPGLEGAGVVRRDRAQRWFRPIGEDFADLRGVPRPLAATLTRMAFGPPPAARGEAVEDLPDDLDALAARVAERGQDGVVADGRWWRWRFTDHPVHRYRIYRGSQAGRTTGMVAARPMTTMGAVFLQILHWEAVDADAAEDVLGAALADNVGCVAATLLATDGGEVAEWARRCGMHRLPSLLDESAGHIALSSPPGARTIVPGRHWNVSLASHHDR